MTTNPDSRPKTRERILDAAMDVFAEKGFSGATISEVERRVGLAVGKGSLYRHFPSKEALLEAAVEREVTRLRAETTQAHMTLPPVTDPTEGRLRQYEQTLGDLRRFDRLVRLMFNEGERVPELRKAIWAALHQPVQGPPHEGNAMEAVVFAALGGYHLLSTMQGRPFNGVTQDQFLRTLVEFTDAGQDPTAAVDE
ncbi:TetR/AcrR family transcriptional regulator [Streptomyces sp. MBT62]|uniref:TetR/AcrR family transcriptional regulator n=1 Tax=Streptomyces sp. MBT62 TaxID=2800410 RepID=UPI0019092385|nr:TetR/AcrR family transcriptional regulator [Streptomyces sp. MBT62]MBK3562877.1 TetR/AcrR family transcriptional regulator [Streptomyces sp. MBT62]